MPREELATAPPSGHFPCRLRAASRVGCGRRLVFFRLLLFLFKQLLQVGKRAHRLAPLFLGLGDRLDLFRLGGRPVDGFRILILSATTLPLITAAAAAPATVRPGRTLVM